MNLFVTFRKTAVPGLADQNPLPFTTPNQPIKRAHSPYSPDMLQASTAGSQIPGFSLFADDELDMPQNRPHVQQPNCTPVQAQSCPPVQLPRNPHLRDELLEDMFKEDPANIPDSWASEDDGETGSDASIPADIDNVPTRGYDQDFWAPLLDTHLGGSDAAEVMAGIAVPKTAPHIIHCTTRDAFDHTILISGELPPYTKPEIGSFPLSTSFTYCAVHGCEH
ncbi:SWIM-type domain-containing protein [Raphanus sativus]|nr:SWIM-type domain-containing protein [Raphanus sativus]